MLSKPPSQNCIKCGYVWESRKKDPVSCPRCKTRLDYGQ